MIKEFTLPDWALTILILVVNGIFTGLGVALGTYIAQKKLIKKAERAERRLKKLLRRAAK